MRSTRALALALLMAAATAAPAAAQSAADVLQRALDRYEANVEGVENYRMTMEAMGLSTTMTMVKTTIDGYPVFVSAEDQDAGTQQWQNPYRTMRQLLDRARLTGTETVGGETCHRILVDDLEGIDFDPSVPTAEDAEFVPEELAFCFDTDDSLVRKMDVKGSVQSDRATTPIEFVALLEDYREVEGFLHPFRTQVTASGMMAGGGSGMSEKELEEARRSLAELESQMESMPAAQREMMEKMLGGQLESLRKMVETGDFTMSIVVTDLDVNVDLDQG